jgi:hypothetical protein
MVGLEAYKKDLIEMAAFYTSLPEKITDPRDEFYAHLGKDAAKSIVKILNEYERRPSHRALKQLHDNLMTLTRGLENFEDEAIQARHRSYGTLRYKIFEYLEAVIK